MHGMTYVGFASSPALAVLCDIVANIFSPRFQITTADVPGPQILYIDNCCSAAAFYRRVFPSLGKNRYYSSRVYGFGAAGPTSKPIAFTYGGPISVIKSAWALSTAMHDLVFNIQSSNGVVGFDCEWYASMIQGVSPGRIAVIQLSRHRMTYI